MPYFKHFETVNHFVTQSSFSKTRFKTPVLKYSVLPGGAYINILEFPVIPATP